MKKTRGKKAKASSHRRLNKPHVSFFKKYFPAILVVAVILTCVVLLNVTNPSGNVVSITGYTLDNGCQDNVPYLCTDGECHASSTECIQSHRGVTSLGKQVTTSPAPNTPVVATGLGDVKIPAVDNAIAEKPSVFFQAVLDFFNSGAESSMRVEDSWRGLVAVLIVFAILLVGVYNILSITSLFDKEFVLWVIAGGLAILASLTGVVRSMTLFFLNIAGGLSAIVIVVEIVISLLIFFGMSTGLNWFKGIAAKRKGDQQQVKAIKVGGEMAAGGKALTEFGRRIMSK